MSAVCLDSTKPETDFHESRYPEGVIAEGINFDDQTRKSMKELIANLVLDIFRKRDLSKLWVAGLFLLTVR